MKKIIILLTALLIFAACTKGNVTNDADTSTNTVSESFAENPDFRNVNWGMSKDQVISLEGTPSSENTYGAPGENRYRLIYNATVSDYSADLSYHFENDMLTRAEYQFDCNDKTDLQINTMYFVLRDEYIAKYSSSDNFSYIILNPNYQNISENPYVLDSGFSFDGMASYNDNWNNANGSMISLSMTYSGMTGNDKSIYFVISHAAINNDI